jgi:hypothetical protein
LRLPGRKTTAEGRDYPEKRSTVAKKTHKPVIWPRIKISRSSMSRITSEGCLQKLSEKLLLGDGTLPLNRPYAPVSHSGVI